jgi:hypothetical protein
MPEPAAQYPPEKTVCRTLELDDDDGGPVDDDEKGRDGGKRGRCGGG